MKREFVKFVNYGKNGVYLYAAIVKVNGIYYWLESVFCKKITDKHKIDVYNMPLKGELNEWSLNKYINN